MVAAVVSNEKVMLTDHHRTETNELAMRQSLKIPLTFAAAHTSLLLLTGIAILASWNSSNADATIGFAMEALTFYIVDYPIGILIEASRPYLSGPGGWLLAVILLYGIPGNAVWFCIGVIVRFLAKCW